MRTEYIQKLARLAKDSGLDAALACPSEELKFLTGFSPSLCERFQGLFVKADATLFYFCNLLYAGEIGQAYGGAIKLYTWFDGDVMTEKIAAAFEAEGLSRASIGVNSTAQAFNVLEIAAKTGVRFTNAKPLFEEMRIIKTHAELEGLRKAAAIADAAFAEVIKFIKPGMTEGDIAAFLSQSMVAKGGANPWCIAASGPNSSFPHYHGKSRVIEKQDFMILDFGCSYDNMCSDMSRTVFIGGITEEQRRIYGIVRESNEAGEAAAVEGAWIPDIDKASRDIIDAAGHKADFVNRLGHGIGYMVHEAPDVKASNPRKLERGMAFSIEPGIYIAGHIGMRVEDIVAITENGTEILNKSTHDIIVINN